MWNSVVSLFVSCLISVLFWAPSALQPIWLPRIAMQLQCLLSFPLPVINSRREQKNRCDQFKLWCLSWLLYWNNNVDGRACKVNTFKKRIGSIIMIVTVNKMCSWTLLTNWVLCVCTTGELSMVMYLWIIYVLPFHIIYVIHSFVI